VQIARADDGPAGQEQTIGETRRAPQIMREFSTRWSGDRSNLVDLCGTGGDAAHTFNISTAAMSSRGRGARVWQHGGASFVRLGQR